MNRICLYIAILILTSCHSGRYLVDHIAPKSIKVDSSYRPQSSNLSILIDPYKKSMDSIMNEEIAILDYDMHKKSPESLLGNWVTDAMKWYMDSVALQPCDFAVCNYGGIRVKALYKGTIALKHIYELMPFDNAITLIDLTDDSLQVFLSKMVAHGSWPISRGIHISMSKKEGLLSYQKANPNKKVTVLAISDYIAHGGDNMTILTRLPQKATNYKIRDILIAYAKHQKHLSAKLEHRMEYNSKSEENE